MIKIYDGRNEFYQWDLDRKLVISDPIVNEVHFCNKTGDCSLVVAVYEKDGLRLADVPNILLQTDWPIRVYAYCGDCYTKESATFKVNARTKPNDYVYTETEVKRWEDLANQIDAKIDEYEDIAIKAETFLDEGLEILNNLQVADNHEKRISNIEHHINGDYFITTEDKNIPANACPYIQVDSIGSMTTKSNNLIPFPYQDGKGVGYTITTGGITYTVNSDRSITLNGTSTGASFLIANYLDLPIADYYLSANHISGEWVDGVYYSNPVAYAMPNTPIVKIPASASEKFTWFSINVSANTTVNNLTFKPMLSAKEALPYGDYYEGLRDNKVTAIKAYSADKEKIAIYTIPEALQGTGKGVEGASDTIDFENGKKITRVGEVLLTEFNWAYSAAYGFYSYLLRDKFIGNRLLCDGYTTDTWNNVYSGKTDGCITGNGQAIIISDSRYTDAASFKASLGDKKLTYALATPTTEDIDTSSFDNLIEVEAGGRLELVNEHGADLPISYTYLAKEGSI